MGRSGWRPSRHVGTALVTRPVDCSRRYRLIVLLVLATLVLVVPVPASAAVISGAAITSDPAPPSTDGPCGSKACGTATNDAACGDHPCGTPTRGPCGDHPCGTASVDAACGDHPCGKPSEGACGPIPCRPPTQQAPCAAACPASVVPPCGPVGCPASPATGSPTDPAASNLGPSSPGAGTSPPAGGCGDQPCNPSYDGEGGATADTGSHSEAAVAGGNRSSRTAVRSSPISKLPLVFFVVVALLTVAAALVVVRRRRARPAPSQDSA